MFDTRITVQEGRWFIHYSAQTAPIELHKPLSLFSNWIVAPLVAAGLSHVFLKGHAQLAVAVILLGSSPCTAMVLVWGKLAAGNQEQNVVNTSLNTVTIMFLYAPLDVGAGVRGQILRTPAFLGCAARRFGLDTRFLYGFLCVLRVSVVNFQRAFGIVFSPIPLSLRRRAAKPECRSTPAGQIAPG